MSYQNQQVKSIGSIYVNTRKGTDQATKDEINGAIDFLRTKKAFLNISLKNTNGEYIKFTGFFNDYKNGDPKKPDIVIRKSEMGQAPQKSYTKPAYNPPPAKPTYTPRPQAPQAPMGLANNNDEVPF